ncbi:MAG: GDP-mannose 4,6-dehydratase [Candidatus ainarchaeum sp.]|nr:GDP-mannose 4,6-dehydratase [Candidatus ainarchaeum sp.]
MDGFWKGKTVLVTGATGMVGSHVAGMLLDRGASVVALARSRDPKSYFFTEGLDSKAVLAYGDLKDFDRVSNVVSRYEVDAIMHLGAQPIVPVALSEPLETLRSNVDGTFNVLEAARRSEKVKAVVVASSDKAYGKSAVLPYVEGMPLSGDEPYEVSKSCSDLISIAYGKTYGLPVAVTRFGNIYGPGDLNFNRIVPGAIRAALTNTALEIRSDGKMIREYLHVDDAAEGYLRLAEKMDSAKGEAFNFSSGESLSVLEVVKKVGEAAGKKIGTRILSTARNEIPEQRLSSEKAAKALGWKARIGMAEGLKATLPWYRKLVFG